MSPIVILSPHRDDAVFSLTHALRYWHNAQIPLRVINVYTVSSYAPRAVIGYAPSVGAVSDLRKREDRRSLDFVVPGVEQRDLGLLDAPLQFDIGVRQVSGPSAIHPSQDSIERLAKFLGPQLRGIRVLAPLGLGNHVNHLEVKRAALICVSRSMLAFYEDLPYACWTTQTEWQARLQEASDGGRNLLRPVKLHSGNKVRWKYRAAKLYQTQIDDVDAFKIASFARRYGGGERVWVPRHSIAWTTASPTK